MTAMAKWIAGFGVVMLAGGSVYAQEPAATLQDLVGARGSSGERVLKERGYNWVRTEKSGGASYAYYQERENGQCIVVRTESGRYASIMLAPAFDCQEGGQHVPPEHGAEGSFETVCGVMVGGEDYRYRCKVEDHYRDGRKTSTTLRFPDQTLRMVWKSGKEVELQFEGMVPMTVRYATSEGETNFVFEDQTYFYYSDKEAARLEVEHFQD